MTEILKMQQNEANNSFSKFIICNYLDWLKPDKHNKPLLSPALFSQKDIPEYKTKQTSILYPDR